VPKYNLTFLVKEMMESDMKLMKKNQFLKDAGHETLNYFE
jgi:GDPmannose 4,6-dehydratase